MEVINPNTDMKDRDFYFSGKLCPPTVARMWHFRSENEYDAQERPENMAVTLIHKCLRCIGRDAFLLLASDIGPASASRTRKGVLWDYKKLRQLPQRAFEIKCKSGETRLVALVDLAEFDFDSAHSALLNYGRSLIVFATHSLENLEELTKQWVSTDTKGVLAFDYEAVGESIQQNLIHGVLRYLPPSISRPETIVVVANANLVSEGALKCIDLLT